MYYWRGVVAMSKENISATVDEDVAEFVGQDHINTSGLVNDLLREYIDSGGDTNAVKMFRIKQLEDEVDDLSNRAERKREKLRELKERRETESQRKESEKRARILNNASEIPASPEHPWVVDHADELDMTPEDFAREIADHHGKEYDPFDDTDDDLRSL